MPFKDLLVVDHGRHGAARIDVAARLARGFDTHLTGLRRITVPVFMSH